MLRNLSSEATGYGQRGLAYAVLPADVRHFAALLMLTQHRYDFRFRPFALSHCPKVQVVGGFLLSHAPDLGGAYKCKRSFNSCHCSSRRPHAPASLGLAQSSSLGANLTRRLWPHKGWFAEGLRFSDHLTLSALKKVRVERPRKTLVLVKILSISLRPATIPKGWINRINSPASTNEISLAF